MYPKMATNINLARKIPAILSMIIAYKTTNLTNENINLINSEYQSDQENSGHIIETKTL